MSETSMLIDITRLAKADGPLTKRISLNADGSLKSDGSACVMSAGWARRARFDSLQAFAATIASLAPHEAVALGTLRHDLPDEVEITTKDRLKALNGSATPHLIARTSDHIVYLPDQPALALIDVDTKGMPPSVRGRLEALGGYWAALVSIIPRLEEAGRVIRRSTSSGISRTDTGEPLPGSDGVHVFVLVEDGGDVERFLRTFHARCWLNGLGWMMVGAGGQLLERSVVDRMVYAPERLVFEGAPVLGPPLAQDKAARNPEVIHGRPLDTRAACLDLSAVEDARLRAMRAAEAHRLAPDVAIARAAFIEHQAKRIAKRTGCSVAAARRAAECQVAGTLLTSVILHFDSPMLGDATVADVLADPGLYLGATLADPLEGIDYGRCKAKIMRRSDGTLWVHSFAHGRTVYELKHDANSVEAAIRAAVPAEAADVFLQLMLFAELGPDEEQRLRDLASGLSGVKARPLSAKIKAAREQQAQQRAREVRNARVATSRDKRLRLTAPLPDAERLPVLRMLDEVLSNTGKAEPPMRDIEGHPVEIRCRAPMALHELSTNGSNQAEPEKSRLPPPSFQLLTRHTKHTLAHEIERHVAFVQETNDGNDRSVALPPVFVEHYLAYRNSTLPHVAAVVTAPLVLPNGTLLAPVGLDRERKLVFRIDQALMALLPATQDCLRRRAVADALEFLADDWLCDVETDFAGKCVLIAMALTTLERVLLPERPAFFVTAGKRGGGKTTALTMVILAVTGKKPPAAAWSANEEERRKAMLAHLSEGLAALVWDNIPLGTAIACPTLEKVLTTDSYSDRLLGQSVTVTVPTYTVMAFTGNNIGPRGDLSSRSLLARIEVDRPDPENRPFQHADPVAWTLDNRGEIMACLYTLLLGNPQFRAGDRKEPKTRFKTWWNLVGAAVEHAAECLVEKQAALPPEWCTARSIDFGSLFASVERDDEDTAGLAQVLDILRATWPDRLFQAANVADFILKPTENEETKAAILRVYFEAPSRRGPGAITSKGIGKRMSGMLGAPVWVENRTLKLVRSSERKSGHVAWFKVMVL